MELIHAEPGQPCSDEDQKNLYSLYTNNVQRGNTKDAQKCTTYSHRKGKDLHAKWERKQAMVCRLSPDHTYRARSLPLPIRATALWFSLYMEEPTLKEIPDGYPLKLIYDL